MLPHSGVYVAIEEIGLVGQKRAATSSENKEKAPINTPASQYSSGNDEGTTNE